MEITENSKTLKFDANGLIPAIVQDHLSLIHISLYEQAGYRKYRASRFEEYALYQEYQRFLPDAQVITFTDLDGKLRAIKPDVTLSIAKTAQPAAGECKRFYYNEEVCRPSRESHTFQTLSLIHL